MKTYVKQVQIDHAWLGSHRGAQTHNPVLGHHELRKINAETDPHGDGTHF